jgi:hypothetical protein
LCNKTKKKMSTNNELKNFLARFPNNATCWSKATDEVRDLARWSRETLEELDGVIVEPINFREIGTPADWNTKGKAYIMANLKKMSNAAKSEFLKMFTRTFITE